MTVFNYSAKRDIVATGFNVTGIDISISSIDNSLNSVTTDLSGLLAGQWVLVSGTAVDDGWHQLDIDSTTNKIKLLSTLTTELAGSSIQIIGYYHGLSAAYDLETDAHTLNPSKVTTNKSSESLSGIRETLHFKNIKYWDILTDYVDQATLPFWEEFFSSVAGNESFNIDLYGSIAAPDTSISVSLDGDVSYTRLNGNTLLYQFSFKVRVL